MFVRYVVSSTNTVNSCLQTSEVMTFVFHVGLPGRRMKKSFRYSQLLFTFRNGSEVFSLFCVKLNTETSDSSGSSSLLIL